MLSEYSVKLLNNVRGRDELEIVLNKVGKENEEKFKRLSRLDLAIKYQEMPVYIFFLSYNKNYNHFDASLFKIVCSSPKLSAKTSRNLEYWHS